MLDKISAEKLVHLQVTVEALNGAGTLHLRANKDLVRYHVQQVKQLVLLDKLNFGLHEQLDF